MSIGYSNGNMVILDWCSQNRSSVGKGRSSQDRLSQDRLSQGRSSQDWSSQDTVLYRVYVRVTYPRAQTTILVGLVVGSTSL